MTHRIWVIVGATSIIAKEFAHLIAAKGISLLLVGRNEAQLTLIAQDIRLRFKVDCAIYVMDMRHSLDGLFKNTAYDKCEFDLFMAHSVFTDNEHLNVKSIHELINVNVLVSTQLINSYLKLTQSKHQLIYLSSVAAARGRAKNSLYGASKACIEIYLQGLQQSATQTQKIAVARLGFIDTKQTYGLPGIIYTASPKECATACLNALARNKSFIYYPYFWRIVMLLIKNIPFFLYKRLKF